jgi:hypothetical protein
VRSVGIIRLIGHDHADRQEISDLHSCFPAKGSDRTLPPGDYPVITDGELIEGLSSSACRRVSTMILVPAQSHRISSVEMVTIDP